MIQRIENPNRPNVSKAILPALAGGAIAVGVQSSLLPVNVLETFKNARAGQDVFVSKAKEAAVETMKQTGKVFDMEQIAENAKEMFPKLAKTTAKKLGVAFAVGALVAGGAKLVADSIANKKAQKTL